MPKGSAQKIDKQNNNEEEESSDEEEFIVEVILAARPCGDPPNWEFLVSWYGYPDDQDSWEPEDHLNCPEILESFFAEWPGNPDFKPGEVIKPKQSWINKHRNRTWEELGDPEKRTSPPKKAARKIPSPAKTKAKQKFSKRVALTKTARTRTGTPASPIRSSSRPASPVSKKLIGAVKELSFGAPGPANILPSPGKRRRTQSLYATRKLARASSSSTETPSSSSSNEGDKPLAKRRKLSQVKVRSLTPRGTERIIRPVKPSSLQSPVEQMDKAALRSVGSPESYGSLFSGSVSDSSTPEPPDTFTAGTTSEAPVAISTSASFATTSVIPVEDLRARSSAGITPASHAAQLLPPQKANQERSVLAPAFQIDQGKADDLQNSKSGANPTYASGTASMAGTTSTMDNSEVTKPRLPSRQVSFNLEKDIQSIVIPLRPPVEPTGQPQTKAISAKQKFMHDASSHMFKLGRKPQKSASISADVPPTPSVTPLKGSLDAQATAFLDSIVNNSLWKGPGRRSSTNPQSEETSSVPMESEPHDKTIMHSEAFDFEAPFQGGDLNARSAVEYLAKHVSSDGSLLCDFHIGKNYPLEVLLSDITSPASNPKIKLETAIKLQSSFKFTQTHSGHSSYYTMLQGSRIIQYAKVVSQDPRFSGIAQWFGQQYQNKVSRAKLEFPGSTPGARWRPGAVVLFSPSHGRLLSQLAVPPQLLALDAAVPHLVLALTVPSISSSNYDISLTTLGNLPLSAVPTLHGLELPPGLLDDIQGKHVAIAPWSDPYNKVELTHSIALKSVLRKAGATLVELSFRRPHFLFIHAGTSVTSVKGLAHRRLHFPEQRFIMFGRTWSQPTAESSIREVWPIGGLVTFTPRIILEQPFAFREFVREVAKFPGFDAYVTPACLAFLHKGYANVEGVEVEVVWIAQDIVLELLSEGSLNLTSCTSPPWITKQHASWVSNALERHCCLLAGLRTAEVLEPPLPFQSESLTPAARALFDSCLSELAELGVDLRAGTREEGEQDGGDQEDDVNTYIQHDIQTFQMQPVGLDTWRRYFWQKRRRGHQAHAKGFRYVLVKEKVQTAVDPVTLWSDGIEVQTLEGFALSKEKLESRRVPRP